MTLFDDLIRIQFDLIHDFEIEKTDAFSLAIEFQRNQMLYAALGLDSDEGGPLEKIVVEFKKGSQKEGAGSVRDQEE